MLVPCPPPLGRGWGGVSAPSLWEGWGGLLVVYRIIYPHIPCRRIAYPPELLGCYSFAPFGGVSLLHPIPRALPGAGISMPHSGRKPPPISIRRALPWADVLLPLRGALLKYNSLWNLFLQFLFCCFCVFLHFRRKPLWMCALQRCR